MAPSMNRIFQCARITGQSRLHVRPRERRQDQDGEQPAEERHRHRRNVGVQRRPMIQLPAQKNGVSVSSRYGEMLRVAAMPRSISAVR